MRKYELKGEIYYYFNDKYVDSNFIEVDILTRQELSKMTGIYLEDDLVRKRKHDLSDNVIRKTITPTASPTYIQMNKAKEYKQVNIDEYIKTEEVRKEVKREPNANMFGGIQKSPKLSDYGLTEKDIEILKSQIETYKEEDNKIWKYNKKCEDESVTAMWWGFGAFWGILILFGMCGGSSGYALAGLIIGAIVGICIKIAKTPTRRTLLPRNSYVNEDLENKVNAYNKAVREYNENISRTKRNYWNNMSGFMFEEAVSELFRKVGARATTTKKVGDHGIDIEMNYKGVWYAVQCKHHISPVGPAPIRELRGVIQDKFKKGIFVSLNGYTQSVYDENELAEKEIILLDRENLIRIAELNSLDLFL